MEEKLYDVKEYKCAVHTFDERTIKGMLHGEAFRCVYSLFHKVRKEGK